MLDLEGGGATREIEMLAPLFLRVGQIRINIGPMEPIAGATCVDDLFFRYLQGLHGLDRAGLVVPKQPPLAHVDAANTATALLQIIDDLFRRAILLLAEALRDDRHV